MQYLVISKSKSTPTTETHHGGLAARSHGEGPEIEAQD